MSCLQVHEHVSDILDGNTPPLLACHLEVCAECAALVAALRQDQGVLLSMSAVEVPPILLDKVMSEVTLTSRNKKAWRFFVPRLAPVAAALALTVLSYNLTPDLWATERRVLPSQSEKTDTALPVPAQEQARVFSMTLVPEGTSEDVVESPASRNPWLVSSLAGGGVFALWSGLVYGWYKKQEARGKKGLKVERVAGR